MATGKIKTLKLKRETTDDADTQAPESGDDDAAQEALTSSTSFQVPATSGGSYTLDAILALVAVLLFSGLIVLQVLELNGYSRPPSVWPSYQQ